MNLLNFVKDTIENGGASFNLLTGEYNPNDGFMLATNGNEIVIPIDQFHQTSVANYISEKAVMLMSGIANSNFFLGSWVDGEKVYLDISEKVDNRQQAEAIGNDRNQIAIWDNANSLEIRLKF